VNNSELGASQTYRSNFVAELPEVYIGTMCVVRVRLLGDKTPSAAARQTFGTFATATSVRTRQSPAVREMSVTEQRYKAVQAVIGAGRTVGEAASEWGVCRRTIHRWLAFNVRVTELPANSYSRLGAKSILPANSWAEYS